VRFEAGTVRGAVLLRVTVSASGEIVGATGTEAGSAIASPETNCSILLRLSKIGVCARLCILSREYNGNDKATYREISVIKLVNLCSTSCVFSSIFSVDPASLTVHCNL
jgi:hypothetical protein